MQIRDVNPSEWDNFVKDSPQGTIFSSTRWLNIFRRPFKMYGFYQGNELCGGIAGFIDNGFESGTLLTPFQGVLLKNEAGKYSTIVSHQDAILGALADYLVSNYSKVKISNHYSLHNIRAFIWRGFKQSIKYTYVVDLNDMPKLWANLEKQTRYEINRMQESRYTLKAGDISDIEAFDRLYNETFERKGLKRPVDSEVIKRIFTEADADLLLCFMKWNLTSATAFLNDDKRAYYILGASDGGNSSYMTLWAGFKILSAKGKKEVDIVGCNDRQIDLFKRGFGGRLEHYFEVSNV